jgi:hypothetical protein
MPAPRAAKSDFSDLSTKHQIETQLHGKLEAARIEYESASEDYRHALKNCDELRWTNPRDGDGNRILVAGQHRGSTSVIRTALNALVAN